MLLQNFSRLFESFIKKKIWVTVKEIAPHLLSKIMCIFKSRGLRKAFNKDGTLLLAESSKITSNKRSMYL